MLHGPHITLRPVREADLDTLYAAHADIRNRGDFFPLGVLSEPAFRRHFAETGFWEKEEGTLVIEAAREDAMNLQACQERVLQLMPTLRTEEARFINERTQAINLEFRWQVLRLRDRVLAVIGLPGQAALSQYVESLKEGMRVFVPKKELAFYRQPQ